MTRHLDARALEQTLTVALRKACEGLVASYLPFPERRRVSLGRLDALVGELARHVAGTTLEDAWRASPPAGPREVGGLSLEAAEELGQRVAEREVNRALALALRLEARYELAADPSRWAAEDEAVAEVRAELEAELARRAEAERQDKEARAAEARARRAERDAERKATEQARAAREQARREAKRREREARAVAKAKAAGGAMPAAVRAAFAELELPIDADRAAVELAFRALLHRVHPDKHVAAGLRAQADAHQRTIRVQAARVRLIKWFEGGGR